MNRLFGFIVLCIKCTYLYFMATCRAITPTRFQKKKDVRGKKVLITGAGSGLGRKLAIEFGKLGSEIIIWDVNQKGLDETLLILRQRGFKATGYKVDLCDNSDINHVADLVNQELGKVDILINNAGIATAKYLPDCTDEMIERSFSVNSKCHFNTVKKFLPKMLETDDGHIVTIASMAGKMPAAGMTDYTASKHAAVGFHDALWAEIVDTGKQGVKATLVCPYYIHTPMFDTTGATTTFPWLFPLLDADYVVGKIVAAVLTDAEFLVMPKAFYLVAATLGMMPYKVQRLVGDYLGLVQSNGRFNREQK